MKVIGVAVVMAAALWAATPAGAQTVTLTGGGANNNPATVHTSIYVTVDASLNAGIPSGTLETSGREGSYLGGGWWYTFTGTVTKMRIVGHRAIVWAWGTVERMQTGGPEHMVLPGSYAQVLSVKYGSFMSPFENEPPLPDEFGVLGQAEQGIPEEDPGVFPAPRSFKDQIVNTGEGFILTRTP